LTARLPLRHAGSASGPPIVSVVAKSNTGKTTLLQSLIPELRALGLSVGVLKHHGHPAAFDMPGKDTFKLSATGADLVVGVSPVQVATFRTVDEPDLDEVLQSSFEGMDIVLTEGHKTGSYPKIEVHRAAHTSELLCTEEQLLAVATDVDLTLDVPQFGIDDARGLAAFLAMWISRANHTNAHASAGVL